MTTSDHDTIQHLCRSHRLDPKAKTLVVGTFSPEHPKNGADFFYGRGRNYLWRLLPISLGEAIDLKDAPVEDKKRFMRRHKVDFIDLIASATVPPRWKINFADRELNNNCGLSWRGIAEETASLPLQRVLFTRKSFNDVTKMRDRVVALVAHFAERGVQVCFLPTPARFYSARKQQEWNSIIGPLL